MFINWIRWDDSPEWYQDKVRIGKEISCVPPGSCPNAVCDVCRSPDGSGISIVFRKTRNSAPVTLAPGDECQEAGAIERMVRKALADAADPGRVERELLGGTDADS